MNNSKPWLEQYSQGIPAEIDPSPYPSLNAMFDEIIANYAQRDVVEYMGKMMSYRTLDQLSNHICNFIQSIGLKKGDRVAIMLPNVFQYQIAMVGILKAGCVVVNVNPQYTARELEYQLNDSGASALIILENFAHVFTSIQAKTSIKKVVVTSLGELIGIKGKLVDFVVRHVKKMVPTWDIPNSINFKEALAIGSKKTFQPTYVEPSDIAFLQYTGGTTGVSKGAVLTHKNIIANVLQIEAWLEPVLKQNKFGQQLSFLCALPLYHIFALTACGFLCMRKGGIALFVPNPKDIPGFIQFLKKHPKIHIFPAVNTLFNALMNHPQFSEVRLPELLATVGGGMAVQKVVADKWKKLMGKPIIEGYGLTETSPVACINLALNQNYTGNVGLPVSSTEVVILDDDGLEVPYGSPGEICIRGPQVMAGYWNKPEETTKTMTNDGYFKSGDIGVMDEQGFTKIIDRKKDMILVSGFNVYPNELEDVIANHPSVLECAVIGIPDDNSGEAVKVFIVKKDPLLTEEVIRDFCKENFTNYKRPKYIEFRTELPKSNVGKILRRQLRPN
jgi:long-chain acyl-CoA synthetase